MLPRNECQTFYEKSLQRTLPRTSYTRGVTPSNLWELFPRPIAEGLREAILFFDRKIEGFAGDKGVLIAPETRTTAPLRFLRDDQMEAIGLPGMMPIGEGAGYAGGIASAAWKDLVQQRSKWLSGCQSNLERDVTESWRRHRLQFQSESIRVAFLSEQHVMGNRCL